MSIKTGCEYVGYIDPWTDEERLSDEEMCHDKNGFDPDTGFECTVCGTMVDSYMVTPADTGHEVQFRYCPFCGRVVDA